jgi:hypothetical protein
MRASDYFLVQAERCRWLAGTVHVRNAPIVEALWGLAAEFEAKAIAAASHDDHLRGREADQADPTSRRDGE